MANEPTEQGVSSLRSKFENIGIGKGHPSVSASHGRRVFSHDQAATSSTPSMIEVASSSRSMFLVPGNHSRLRSLSNPNASDVETANQNEAEVTPSQSRRSSGIRASPSSPDLATPFQSDEPPERGNMHLDATCGYARNAATLPRRSAPPPPPPPTAPRPNIVSPASPFTALAPASSILEPHAPVRVGSPATDSSLRRPPPPPPPRRLSDRAASESDLSSEASQPSGIASLRAKLFHQSSQSSLGPQQPPPPPFRSLALSRSSSPVSNSQVTPRSLGSSSLPPPLPARNSTNLDGAAVEMSLRAPTMSSNPPAVSPTKSQFGIVAPPVHPSRALQRQGTDPDNWDYLDDIRDPELGYHGASLSQHGPEGGVSYLFDKTPRASVSPLPPPSSRSSSSSSFNRPLTGSGQTSPVRVPPRPPPIVPPRPVPRDPLHPASPTSSHTMAPRLPTRKPVSSSTFNQSVEDILGPPPLPSRPTSALYETHPDPPNTQPPPPPPLRLKGLTSANKIKISATTAFHAGARHDSPTPDNTTFTIPPPPTRTVGPGVIPAARPPTAGYASSESSEDEVTESPLSFHDATQVSKGGRQIEELPDSSSSNREPPMHYPRFSAPVPAHVGLVAVAGNWVCVASHDIKMYNMTSPSREPEFHVELKDTGLDWKSKEPRVTAMEFRPARAQEDTGRYLWCGTKDGHLFELDAWSGGITDARPGCHTSVVVHILRHGKSMVTIDETGKLLIFTVAEGERYVLSGSIPKTHRIPEKQSFARILHGQLWTSGGLGSTGAGAATKTLGPTIRVFDFASPGLAARSIRPPDPVGAVTAGTMIPAKPTLAYLGHENGQVSIWDLTPSSGSENGLPVCISIVKVGPSDVLSLEGVQDKLWAGSRKGSVSVYNVDAKPWQVTNVWHAHGEYPVLKLAVDPFSLESCGRLTVYSLGRDEIINFWDGFLAQDWIEHELRRHEASFSSFRKIKILICTWNVDAVKPEALAGNTDNLSFLNTLLESVDGPDVIVFGFQEIIDLESTKLTAKTVLLGTQKRKADGSISEKVSRHYRQWHDKLVFAVRLAMPPESPYTVVHTENLVGLFTCIFVRNSQRISLRDTAITTVKRGMGGRYGNKGAIVTRFVVDDTSICFLNCHLAAGQSHKQARNRDLAAIFEEKSVFSSETLEAPLAYVGGGDGTMILDHEICFLNGDLNYRIDLRRDAVIASIRASELDYLLTHDQLLKEVKLNPGFRLRAFHEAKIAFAPTYKYDPGTSTYDTSEKKRVPAWCDRILYRCREPARVRCLHYRRYETNVSDHKPVSGGFEVTIKSVRAADRAAVKQQVEKEYGARQVSLLQDALRFYKKSL